MRPFTSILILNALYLIHAAHIPRKFLDLDQHDHNREATSVSGSNLKHMNLLHVSASTKDHHEHIAVGHIAQKRQIHNADYSTSQKPSPQQDSNSNSTTAAATSKTSPDHTAKDVSPVDHGKRAPSSLEKLHQSSPVHPGPRSVPEPLSDEDVLEERDMPASPASPPADAPANPASAASQVLASAGAPAAPAVPKADKRGVPPMPNAPSMAAEIVPAGVVPASPKAGKRAAPPTPDVPGMATKLVPAGVVPAAPGADKRAAPPTPGVPAMTGNLVPAGVAPVPPKTDKRAAPPTPGLPDAAAKLLPAGVAPPKTAKRAVPPAPESLLPLASVPAAPPKASTDDSTPSNSSKRAFPAVDAPKRLLSRWASSLTDKWFGPRGTSSEDSKLAMGPKPAVSGSSPLVRKWIHAHGNVKKVAGERKMKKVKGSSTSVQGPVRS
ncbi:hypothetical protein V5O48_004477 [Marasmius crinis-equi]|uniref:Uncharacterized protein n=1 Tax=Marasmius crinis-equi TaxID=585013 RepID=A0ABR3FQ20_9AGAR